MPKANKSSSRLRKGFPLGGAENSEEAESIRKQLP
jgi:hypothetical protein